MKDKDVKPVKKKIVISSEQIMEAVNQYSQLFGEREWGMEKNTPYISKFVIRGDTLTLVLEPKPIYGTPPKTLLEEAQKGDIDDTL